MIACVWNYYHFNAIDGLTLIPCDWWSVCGRQVSSSKPPETFCRRFCRPCSKPRRVEPGSQSAAPPPDRRWSCCWNNPPNHAQLQKQITAHSLAHIYVPICKVGFLAHQSIWCATPMPSIPYTLAAGLVLRSIGSLYYYSFISPKSSTHIRH